MDTISTRESNTNYLPLAGVIAGVAALLLAIFAFVKISSLKNEVAELKELSNRISGIEGQAAQAMSAAQTAAGLQADLRRNAVETNNAFTQVSNQLGEIRGRLDKVEAARAAATTARAAQAAGAATATAGSDEYVVKSGDTGGKIATATGFSVAQLEAVNPGIDWRRLHIGQKIKLPKK